MTVMGAGLAVVGFGPPPAHASDVVVDFGRLIVIGDNDADAITLSVSGNTLTVTDTGTGGATTSDPECSAVNGTTVTCPTLPATDDPVTTYQVNLGDGVDSFTNQNFAADFSNVSAFAATGAKTINAGPGTQFIAGGTDGDVIDGGDGGDVINDGSGEVAGGDTGGTDTLIGGPGDDLVDYQRAATLPMNVTLDGVANDGYAGENDNVQTEGVATGLGNDVVTGDAGANFIVGYAGDDTLLGAGGADELFGDFSDSPSIAARATSMLRGSPALFTGNDTLDGGAGRDGLDCGRGIDVALRQPLDEVETDCERIGADVVGDSSTLSGKKKNKFKVALLCPDSEPEACTGNLRVAAGGKKVGKGKFSVTPGKTRNAKAKLTKKGTKAVKRAGGSLLVTVAAKTNEPGGVAESNGSVLVSR